VTGHPQKGGNPSRNYKSCALISVLIGVLITGPIAYARFYMMELLWFLSPGIFLFDSIIQYMVPFVLSNMRYT